MSTPENPSPGWYPDPLRPGAQRWWTGVGWSETTQHVVPDAAPPQGSPPPYPPPAYAPPEYAPPAYSPQNYATPAYAPLAPGQSPYGPAASYGSGAPYGAYAAELASPGSPMGFGEAIASVFRKYAGFGGRASRSEFWYWTLFCAIGVIAGYVLVAIGAASGGQSSSWIAQYGLLLLFVLGLAIFLPSLAVTVRRLRDAGLHWALIFLQLIPYVGGIVVLILCAQRAKPWPLPRV